MTPESELRALVERYAATVDARTFDRFDQVFTPDAVLETARGVRDGLAEIQAAMQGLQRYVSTDHRVGESSAVVEGETAIGLVACEAHHVDDTGADRVMTITYHDRYVTTPDGWRIAHRRLEVLDERTV